MHSGRPNFLVLVFDELRAQAVGHLGGPVATPAMDRLAAEGVSFSRAYTPFPMCTPARAALLSGRFPHGLHDEAGETYWFNNRLLNPESPSFARSLGEAGYECGYVGKWHTDRDRAGTPVPAGPRRMGFDAWWRGINVGAPRTAPFAYDDAGRRIESGRDWEPDLQADLAEEFLRARARGAGQAGGGAGEGGAPFCLVVSCLPPHGPLDLPARYESWREEAARRLAAFGHRANVPERVRAVADEEWIGYHANVIGVDAIVGRLLAALDSSGLAEDTVVVLTSDHGSHVLSHGLRGKNQCYEEAVKVPWIVRWPGRIAAGRQADDFCGLVDFAPTLLELAGVAGEPAMQGRSMAGVLLRGERGPHRSAFVEVHHPWWDYRYGQGPGGMKRALITEEWKLVLIESRLGTGGAIPWQLFDRVKDPCELHNLAEDPGCQEVICELMPEMWRWLDGLGDDFAALTRCGINGPGAGCWAPDPTKPRHEP